MKKGPKKIPQFKTEDEEREFWLTHSAFDYWDQMEPVNEPIIITVPRKKPITMMWDPDLQQKTKILAGAKHMPYQTLARQWMREKCEEEWGVYERKHPPALQLSQVKRKPSSVVAHKKGQRARVVVQGQRAKAGNRRKRAARA